jgi:hypothetical protein
VEEALEDVRSGKLWGYMSFPQNYTQHSLDRAVAGRFAENESISESTIEFRLDMSRKLKKGLFPMMYSNAFLNSVNWEC